MHYSYTAYFIKNQEVSCMNLFELTGVELKKLRRSKILLILTTAVLILWLPSIFNASINFEMSDVGISPEHNFLIQGLLGMAWFMYPACMVVATVLVTQTERSSRGILKMLSLPVSTTRLSLAKFIILLGLSALQMILTAGTYVLSAAITTHLQHYDFSLPLPYVLKLCGLLYLTSIPMLAFFWMTAVCVDTPIFSIGIGLASIVPSVLIMNTKLWFLYPMAYPFYVITSEYGKAAEHMDTWNTNLFPWIPVACLITLVCLLTACICFGKSEK